MALFAWNPGIIASVGLILRGGQDGCAQLMRSIFRYHARSTTLLLTGLAAVSPRPLYWLSAGLATAVLHPSDHMSGTHGSIKGDR